MSAGSMDSPIEGDLPTERKAEVEGVSIWFRIHGLLERFQKLLTQRHSDRGPPDYEQDLSELRDLARRGMRGYQPGIQIEGGYNERGNRKGNNSWKDWVLTICGPLIVLGIAGVIYQLADMKADQRAFLTSQKALEKRVDRIEQKVFP